MSRSVRLLTAGAVGLSVFFGAFASASVASADDVVHQVGTYDYLVQPNFSGIAELSEAIAGATVGLGTFANLDGEFVMVGGEGYRVPTSGTPVRVSGDESTPFAQAVKFTARKSVPVPPGTLCSQLPVLIDGAAGDVAGLVAVRVRGTFTALTTRSVPAQQEPWPALSAVIAQQTTFPLDGRKAVLVGFHQGPHFLGVGQPGLHLHGVTTDRSAGGHVLSCTAGSDVQLSIQPMAGVKVVGG